MVMINLLPWRENKRLYQLNMTKKIGWISFFVHIIFLCSWYILFTQLKQRVDTRLINLESQVKEFSVWQKSLQTLNEINKNVNKNHAMNNRIMHYRLTIWQLFSWVQKNPNKSICFIQVKHIKNTYQFIGKAHSIIDLMTYLNQLNTTNLFSSIAVSSLEQKSGAIQFRFVTKDKNPFSWSILGTSSNDL